MVTLKLEAQVKQANDSYNNTVFWCGNKRIKQRSTNIISNFLDQNSWKIVCTIKTREWRYLFSLPLRLSAIPWFKHWGHTGKGPGVTGVVNFPSFETSSAFISAQNHCRSVMRGVNHSFLYKTCDILVSSTMFWFSVKYKKHLGTPLVFLKGQLYQMRYI